MSLFYTLPETQTFRAADVLRHKSSDGYVNRNAEWCRRQVEAVMYAPLMTEEEKAAYLSQVAAIDARNAGKRDLFTQ